MEEVKKEGMRYWGEVAEGEREELGTFVSWMRGIVDGEEGEGEVWLDGMLLKELVGVRLRKGKWAFREVKKRDWFVEGVATQTVKRRRLANSFEYRLGYLARLVRRYSRRGELKLLKKMLLQTELGIPMEDSARLLDVSREAIRELRLVLGADGRVMRERRKRMRERIYREFVEMGRSYDKVARKFGLFKGDVMLLVEGWEKGEEERSVLMDLTLSANDNRKVLRNLGDDSRGE